MNNNDSHIDETRLMRYLTGEATHEEIQQVEQWTQRSEENRKYLDRLETVWLEADQLPYRPVDVDYSKAWKNLSRRIDDYEFESSAEGSKILRPGKRIYKIAGAIAAIFIIAFGLYQLVLKSPQLQITLASAGQVVEDTLPDGSRVILNKQSELTYQENKGNNQRIVLLKGEAFFEVTHNPRKPFIVGAGNAHARVVGTSFNVSAYEGREVEVLVTEGKVKLSGSYPDETDTSFVILEKGMKGRLGIDKKKPQIVEQKHPDELFWLHHRLVFDETTLKLVFEILEKHYDISINVKNDTILAYKLTTIFTEESIDNILRVIESTFKLDIEKDGTTYTFQLNKQNEEIH